MTILEATGIYSGYGETEILHGVSMQLDAGELVTIIGPNGAGKSTLVKTIIGLLKPKKGQVVFEGKHITGRNPEDLVLHGLAYIPQSNNTFPTLTVRENLEMGAITRRPGWLGTFHRRLGERFSGWLPWNRTKDTDGSQDVVASSFTRDEFERRVQAIVEIFPNLGPKLDVGVNTMSGGEQQMVALAKTLILEPKVLLIDEPSAGLAPQLVAPIFEKIQEINEGGGGIVLVEQNAKKALSFADRGYVLEGGKNRYEGPGQALLNNPEVGRLYLGG